ncbi:Spy/CpxP family protein refolding chaperone [Ningiella sp. W23]|uniref:Spy/CpxP family protein refolding chaperone n=1 Tax=Ningiella sp. W23 TaxID=3023715 RepID=UPI003757C0DD
MKSTLNKSFLPIVSGIALTASLILSSISLVNAQSVGNSHFAAQADASQMQQKRSAKRMFAKLDLSETQKQDIAAIFQQLAQDNSVYRGEKKALREQMQALMQLETWDAALAEDLVTQRVQQSAGVQLNMAKARNQAFNVLNEEQQVEFLQRLDKRAEKEKKRPREFDRLAKVLHLTDEQASEIDLIKESAEQANTGFVDALQDFRQAERDIVFSDSFDEDAWLALQTSVEATKISAGLNNASAKFEMLSVLDEKQRDRLQQIGERKPRKNKGTRDQRS